ncbi:MAG: branched-chain amino acid ABC transporter permease [Desulfomonile tiedjei]|nr:branched-chain amino acid ABC transporter permease [Desulfomonile tiedjei]
MDKSPSNNNISWIAGVVVAVALFVLPLVLARFGKTGEYWIWVTTEMIIMALFAMSLNLILGFGGMVSFGHAAFFGVGAYTVALLMKKAGWPLYLALPAAPVVAAITAAIIGWFCVRLLGLYFSILTLAFSQLLYMIVFQWYTFTGGDDGIHGIPRPESLGAINYYWLCVVLFLICFLVMRMIVNSSFGLSIRTIRENLERAKFIGINVRRYQLINFIIAGAFAGLAGGLLTELNRFAQTEFLHWSKSAEPILASLVGGMYSLVGPAIGSAVLMFLKIILQQLHRSMVEMWAIVLGLILLVVVLFAPGGLVGLYDRFFGKSES